MKRVLAGLAILATATWAAAHPLGNNTVNRLAALHLQDDAIAVRYVVDMAEIPTLFAAQNADADGDGSVSAGEWTAYAARYGERIRSGLRLAVNGTAVPPIVLRSHWALVPGDAGLVTLRVETDLAVPLPRGAAVTIEYRDVRRADEAGWKEVIATAGDSVRLIAADVPQASASGDLTVYPEAGTPAPNVLAATVVAAITAAGTSRASVRMAGADPQSEAASRTGETSAARPAPPRFDSASADAAAAAPEPLTADPAGGAHAASAAPQPWAFFRLGVHHIATGWDHLVFLLGLVAAQTALRRLIWVVTAFTVAHSLTLALAAGGVLSPPGAWVEPAIALTIAYVGLSNLLGGHRHGAVLAFIFGLIHGLGFAGALAESLGGTPSGSNWLLSLAAFNVGIEVFQLALVVAIVPILRRAAHLSWSATAHKVASIAVVAAGLAWFVARV